MSSVSFLLFSDLFSLQALLAQRAACAAHTALSSARSSLLVDHRCSRARVPSRTLAVLAGHTDEVRFPAD